MPRVKTIKSDNPLFQLTNQNYTIQLEPFEKLLKIVSYSLLSFRKPALFKVVIYLKNEQQELPPVIDELKRLYVANSSCPGLLQHWAREYKVDSKHYGTHYHFTFIGETRDRGGKEWNVEQRLKAALHQLQSRGWINNYDFSEPWSLTMKPHSLKACCSDPERAQDLVKWLSYNCKAETKEEVGGRRYGGSIVPAGTPTLELPVQQQPEWLVA